MADRGDQHRLRAARLVGGPTCPAQQPDGLLLAADVVEATKHHFLGAIPCPRECNGEFTARPIRGCYGHLGAANRAGGRCARVCVRACADRGVDGGGNTRSPGCAVGFRARATPRPRATPAPSRTAFQEPRIEGGRVGRRRQQGAGDAVLEDDPTRRLIEHGKSHRRGGEHYAAECLAFEHTPRADAKRREHEPVDQQDERPLHGEHNRRQCDGPGNRPLQIGGNRAPVEGRHRNPLRAGDALNNEEIAAAAHEPNALVGKLEHRR